MKKIKRGYKPNHKVAESVKMAEQRATNLISIIICPQCGEHNRAVGRYDEDIDSQITCSSCRMTFSKWNYEFLMMELTQ